MLRDRCMHPLRSKDKEWRNQGFHIVWDVEKVISSVPILTSW